MTLKHDVRIEDHFVGIDNVEVSRVAEDKNVPRESLNGLNGESFGDKKLWGGDTDASAIICVPQSQPVVRVERAEPESARIEDVWGWAPHDAVRDQRARGLLCRP